MKIIWSDFAIYNLKAIFEYYAVNANKKVAHKLRKQILQSTDRLIKNPESGQIETYLVKFQKNHRYILSGNYKIIYRIENDTIIINDVFDVRQNPDKINVD
ncbi:type II toxin-antitoxin system RelE/ParE family toxin [Salegentibacter sp. JZCK2]|uniref:type II toxin-antitoxin system RelE/ParE family toxin n=1 Tax=Salegentibacter tibetensis TaxID=2873600 RepID=UPI001CCA995A|nr:type II toxin-antitoxin system RelE/ParE family toxin [Salegentibacter tibetensis]MBZ9728618.1 type II toxin-antitoxin system RelE/ParE family toxin [Salegentibacter tibetensis]